MKDMMNSQQMVVNLVGVVVKEEKVENGELTETEDGQPVDIHVKCERDEPEENSTDSNCYESVDIKSAISLFDETGTNENVDFREVNSANIERGRTSHFRDVQEMQNSSRNGSDGNFCECDVCGSFFCEDARSNRNKPRGSAKLCPECRRSTAGSTSFSQRVSSTSMSSPTGRHPCSEKWRGVYNFAVEVNALPNTKNTLLYSSLLNKVYATANTTIPIQYRCQWGEPDLYVRALPVFLNEVTEPVIRCIHHMRPSEETNAGFPYVDHVVRCHHDMCSYERDESTGRLSVVAPLGSPPPGSDVVTILYKVMCKTSCLGGMNRRPIQIIFTLERYSKEVIGRDTLQVRVCSCPHRDMKKEELRPQANSKEPRRHAKDSPGDETCVMCKKPKLETGDVSYIPLRGGTSVLKKAAMLLRTNLIGKKLAAGEDLTKEDHINWKTLNRLLSDGAGHSGV